MLDAAKAVKSCTIHEKSGKAKPKKEDDPPPKSALSRRRSSTPPSSAKRSSIASDKIPVIKISKTESEECILEPNNRSSPKQRFRDAVNKQIEAFRTQKNNERQAIQRKLYGGRKTHEMKEKKRKVEVPLEETSVGPEIEDIQEEESLCPIAKEESVPSELNG